MTTYLLPRNLQRYRHDSIMSPHFSTYFEARSKFRPKHLLLNAPRKYCQRFVYGGVVLRLLARKRTQGPDGSIRAISYSILGGTSRSAWSVRIGDPPVILMTFRYLMTVARGLCQPRRQMYGMHCLLDGEEFIDSCLVRLYQPRGAPLDLQQGPQPGLRRRGAPGAGKRRREPEYLGTQGPPRARGRNRAVV